MKLTLINRNLWVGLVALVGMAFMGGCASKNLHGDMAMSDRQGALGETQDSKAPSKPKDAEKLSAQEFEALADMHVRQGNLSMAFVNYQKALQANPNRHQILYKEAMLFMAKNMKEDAVASLRAYLEKSPKDASAHEAIADALYGMGRYEEAEKHILQSVALDDKRWKAHNMLGMIRDYQGRYAEALQEYQKAIALRPGEWILHNNLGLCYTVLGDYDNAILAFSTALRSNTSQATIYNNLGLVLGKTGRYQEALEAFKSAGDDAQAFNNLGCIYMQQAKYQDAINSFEKAVELKPSFYANAQENLRKAKTLIGNSADSASRKAAARIQKTVNKVGAQNTSDKKEDSLPM